VLAAVLTAAGCADVDRVTPSPAAVRSAVPSPAPSASPVPSRASADLPGMPPVEDGNVYARTTPQDLAPAVRGVPPYVYVPNGKSDTVSVIDQRTGQVLRTFDVGRQPEHVVPSYDLRWLWVTSDKANSLTKIDPRTGKPVGRVHVDDPYNLYFTPDGKSAVVVAERLQRLDFRDPHTMRLQQSVPLTCRGVDHADWSGDGRYFIATCEFSGRLVKVDTVKRRVVGYLELGGDASPQDVRVAGDGHTFWVADQSLNGIVLVDGRSFRRIGFLAGFRGAHGIYPSRDARSFYVSDRRGSAVTVVDIATRKVKAVWPIPGGGSPDMGGVSVDGTRLWLSGRYTSYVYEFDTRTGAVLRKVGVGEGPHGVSVWPQPGRYSLGHTDNTR
jgi:YVTN family beta-propeller protein